ADWRSGVPESVDQETLEARAAETASLLARRAQACLLYLPAPLPPLFPDPSRGAAFARSLESLALGLGARLLPADAFALGGYLSSGCPVGGTWIGRVAEAVVDAAAAPRAEPKKVLDRSGQRPVERIDSRGGTGGHCRRAFGSWIPALSLSELVAPAAARGHRPRGRESQRSRRRGGAISLGALAAA